MCGQRFLFFTYSGSHCSYLLHFLTLDEIDYYFFLNSFHFLWIHFIEIFLYFCFVYSLKIRCNLYSSHCIINYFKLHIYNRKPLVLAENKSHFFCATIYLSWCTKSNPYILRILVHTNAGRIRSGYIIKNLCR